MLGVAEPYHQVSSSVWGTRACYRHMLITSCQVATGTMEERHFQESHCAEQRISKVQIFKREKCQVVIQVPYSGTEMSSLFAMHIVPQNSTITPCQHSASGLFHSRRPSAIC